MIRYVVGHARAAYQFVLDVKIGADLGYPWPEAIRFAWSSWGWQN